MKDIIRDSANDLKKEIKLAIFRSSGITPKTFYSTELDSVIVIDNDFCIEFFYTKKDDDEILMEFQTSLEDKRRDYVSIKISDNGCEYDSNIFDNEPHTAILEKWKAYYTKHKVFEMISEIVITCRAYVRHIRKLNDISK